MPSTAVRRLANMPRGGMLIMAALAAANIGIWAAALIVFHHYPLLLGTALLA